jgi:hypothetical protein
MRAHRRVKTATTLAVPAVVFATVVTLAITGATVRALPPASIRSARVLPPPPLSPAGQQVRQIHQLDCQPNVPCVFPTVETAGVILTVGGRTLSSASLDRAIKSTWVYLADTQAETSNGTAPILSPSDPRVVPYAVAGAAFDDMIQQTAAKTETVSNDQINSFIQSQENNLNGQGVSSQLPLPPALQSTASAGAYYASPTTVEAIRDMIAASEYQQSIVNSRPAGETPNAALNNWMVAHVSDLGVTVAGLGSTSAAGLANIRFPPGT